MSLTGGAFAQAISMNIPADKTHRQVAVVVTKGLISTKKLPTPALRDARKRMLANKPVTPVELRDLADHGDGLAAQKYQRYLVENIATSTASDIAYYGTVALGTGRVWALPAVVDALRRVDPATEPAERKKAYVAVLYPYAWAGNSLALDAVIDLNGTDKLFGEMSKATQDRIAAQGEKAGDGRVALRLAIALLQKPDRSKADVALAQHFLKRAQASDNLQVQATADNLATLLASDGTLMAVKE
jgi:hypothetical protein